MKPRILIAIPTFNCSVQIIQVLEDISNHAFGENVTFWVIDNQSQDSTFEICKQFIAERRIFNVSADQTIQNNSLGGTHKIAFNRAISLSFDYVGIFHGDNQGRIEDLYRILLEIENLKTTQSVLGTRFSRKSSLEGYSRKRILGNLLLNTLYSLVSRRVLTDLGSGINVYKTVDLKKIQYMYFGDTLSFNYQLILDLSRTNAPFHFFPINWRQEGQVSNARELNVFASGVFIALRHLIWSPKRISLENKVYKVRGDE